MSATDFERNDGLDGLSSEELETRAFGPARDRPRGPGWLARRPRTAQLRATRPLPPGRRRVAVGVLTVGMGVTVALLLTVATIDPSHFSVHEQERVLVIEDDGLTVDGPASGFYFDDEGVYDRIEESAVYRRALVEEAEVVVGDGEIR